MSEHAWRPASSPPPADNETIELSDGRGSIITGWCSRRFLQGKPTYWVWPRGEAERPVLVQPMFWRPRAGGGVMP